jgi:hypothetical protein
MPMKLFKLYRADLYMWLPTPIRAIDPERKRDSKQAGGSFRFSPGFCRGFIEVIKYHITSNPCILHVFQSVKCVLLYAPFNFIAGKVSNGN